MGLNMKCRRMDGLMKADFTSTPIAAEPATTIDDITVVVVTFNSAHCLPDLATGLAGYRHVIVVDNASQDDCVQAAAQYLPQARVIVNDANRGFGAANNRGLAEVTTRYALLLNPDCQLDAAGATALLATAVRFAGAALVVPQIVAPDGRPEVNYRWSSAHWTSRGPGAEAVCSVGFACGAAWLLNMAVMRDVGGFDEAFFLYYEDDDLCHRIVARGHMIVVDPAVQAVHASRGSVRGPRRLRSEYLRGFHHAQSKLRFSDKYGRPGASRTLQRKTFWVAVLALPLRLMVWSPRHLARLWGRLRGAWSYLPAAHDRFL
jgi:N-acetylglucosaminyl-diphospho-decaprenol L-rhamnosyltransferase